MATRAFWNNPIVVSAFRVKYRKSAPTLTATLWLLALAGLGVVMHHNLAGTTGVVPWYRLYFAVVIGVQAALAGVLALSSTHASITSEVGNRTLDFQRIASLSPFSILVGKLFGEPAIAYLLVFASIPISLIFPTISP